MILKLTPVQSRELTKCCCCGIKFLTAVSNRGRKDIYCPFGCREKHKKASSHQRSKAYYKTEPGKEKKRRLNRNRYRQPIKSREDEKKIKNSREESISLVGHIRFVFSLLEGRHISWLEIKKILLEYFKKWRQHPLEYWLKVCNMSV
jgi:hypothetical protein